LLDSITLAINGKQRTVKVRRNTPLLWVLRDSLGLTGTKYGCGKGLCGACTVHLDGVAARSCLLQVADVGTRAVTTLEGLSGSKLHPVQQAWIDHSVPQCGYCQSGQIMSAAAFLEQNPQPTDAEIISGMSGNLCRCGTYRRIVAAVRDAAPVLREAKE